MRTDEAVQQWKQLKKSRALIDKRLAELKLYITGHIKEASQYGLELQVRDRTTFDENKVWELMDRKGIHHALFTKKVIEPSLVEQLYLEGKLTDSELREIRVPKYINALVGGDDSVQRFNEGDG